MDKFKHLLSLIKSTVQITTLDGDYEGVVRLVCPVTRKLILEKLVFLPKQLFMGVQQFHINEILSYKIISKSQSNSSEDQEVAFDTLEDNKIDISNNLPKEDTYVYHFPQSFNLKLPTESVILDHFGEEYHQAIEIIQKLTSIGVSLDGPRISRDGILSWISIATPCCTFLFDIQSMKDKVFGKDGLLKDIFENPRIEKILHDCRKASDCLYHKFDTKLVNVFDTQVADLVVALQVNQKGTIPQKVNSLNFCLGKYLNVSNYFISKPKHKSYIDEVIYYRVRPLQNKTRDLLIGKVIYLRALKQRLHSLLLNPFRRAVSVYLQVVQNATDQELLLEPPSEDEVPYQLIMEGLQTVRFRDPVPVSSLALPEFNVMNTVENYANLCKSNKHNPGNNLSKIENVKSCSKFEHGNGFDLGATSKSDGYTKDEELLNQTLRTRQSESKNEDRIIGPSFREQINTGFQSMNHKQAINNEESLDKTLEMKNKEKFRLSRLKFNNLNSHVNPNSTKNTNNNGRADSASSIESIPSEYDILSEKEKYRSHEDPYAKLRQAFTNTCDTENEEKRKLKFIPAGMS